MRVLVIGDGAREHAIERAVAKSQYCDKVFVCNGNCGTLNNVHWSTPAQLRSFIRAAKISLVVIGPDRYLADGMVDQLQDIVAVIGPTKAASRLEWDKKWAKEFMFRHNIPTPKYVSLQEYESIIEVLKTATYPIVLKANVLAAGKGVFVCKDFEEAKATVKDIHDRFGRTILIEDYLSGLELSFFILVRNGGSYAVLPEAMDYKQLKDGDLGPNTGGMGAISPVPFCSDILVSRIKEKIVEPTIKGLKDEGITYTGFLYLGLMIKDGEPYLLEYNCRLGDPEAQVILPRIETDFVQLMLGAGVQVDNTHTVGVTIASAGYPNKSVTGAVIKGLNKRDLTFCYNGIFEYKRHRDGRHESFVVNGGRLLTVVGQDSTLERARKNAYTHVNKISFDGMQYRTDIGSYRL